MASKARREITITPSLEYSTMREFISSKRQPQRQNTPQLPSTKDDDLSAIMQRRRQQADGQDIFGSSTDPFASKMNRGTISTTNANDASGEYSNNSMRSDLYDAMMKRRDVTRNATIKSPRKQDKEKFKHVQVDSNLQAKLRMRRLAEESPSVESGTCADDESELKELKSSPKRAASDLSVRNFAQEFAVADASLQAAERSAFEVSQREENLAESSVSENNLADDEDFSGNVDDSESDGHSRSDDGNEAYNSEDHGEDNDACTSEDNGLDMSEGKGTDNEECNTEDDFPGAKDSGDESEAYITRDDARDGSYSGDENQDYNTEDEAQDAEASDGEDQVYSTHDDALIDVDSGDEDQEYITDDDAEKFDDAGDDDQDYKSGDSVGDDDQAYKSGDSAEESNHEDQTYQSRQSPSRDMSFFAPPDDQNERTALDDLHSDTQSSQEEAMENNSERDEQDYDFGNDENDELYDMEDHTANRNVYDEQTMYDEQTVITEDAENYSSASRNGDQLEEIMDDEEQYSDDQGENDTMYESGSAYSGRGTNDSWSAEEKEEENNNRPLGDHMKSAASSYNDFEGERSIMGEMAVLDIVREEGTVDEDDESKASVSDDNVFGGKIIDGRVDRDIPMGDDDYKPNEILNPSEAEKEIERNKGIAPSEQAPPENLKKKFSLSCSWPWKISAVLVCSLAIGIGIGVFFLSGSKSNTSNPEKQTATVSPTRDPKLANLTASSMASYDLICPVLNSCVGLLDVSTPQGQAFDWLVNDKDANPLLEQIADNTKIRRYALATFYFSTKGDSWTNKTDWLSGKSECDWFSTADYGTGCGVDRRDFTALELDNNNIQGELPFELALLSSLNRISLKNPVGTPPYIRGSISSHLGNLTALTSVVISGNQFSGGIPVELGKWTNVETLDLSDNGVNGVIPQSLASLTKLTTLNLEGNYFAGDIDPSVFVGASLLVKVNLERNQLTGVPTSIMGLSQLRSLNIGVNKLASFPLAVTQLHNLNYLDLRENSLAGQIPVELGGMSSLQALILEGNHFTGNIPVELGNLVQLNEVLDLSSNALSGPIPSTLGHLVKLKRLLLYGNNLQGQLPVELAALSSIVEVRINGNGLTGEIPPEICALYDVKLPASFADCSELTNATCFTYCCTDGAGCVCRYENTDPLKCIKQVYIT